MCTCAGTPQNRNRQTVQVSDNATDLKSTCIYADTIQNKKLSDNATDLQHVLVQVPLLREGPGALGAGEALGGGGVDKGVRAQVRLVGESSLALWPRAAERPLSGVGPHVALEQPGAREHPGTHPALVARLPYRRRAALPEVPTSLQGAPAPLTITPSPSSSSSGGAPIPVVGRQVEVEVCESGELQAALRALLRRRRRRRPAFQTSLLVRRPFRRSSSFRAGGVIQQGILTGVATVADLGTRLLAVPRRRHRGVARLRGELRRQGFLLLSPWASSAFRRRDGGRVAGARGVAAPNLPIGQVAQGGAKRVAGSSGRCGQQRVGRDGGVRAAVGGSQHEGHGIGKDAERELQRVLGRDASSHGADPPTAVAAALRRSGAISTFWDGFVSQLRESAVFTFGF